MNKEQFINYCINSLGLNKTQINQFLEYKNLIQEYNKKFNLTRLDDENIIYDSFFLESILPFKEISFSPKENESLLDIGSGSGIPGIILKIMFPILNVSLLESNSKKCSFLKIVIEQLKLKNIEIINNRAELYIRTNNQYDKFDYVTSRAVSELKNILELSVGYCKINGLIIQPKSKKTEQEMQQATEIIDKTYLTLIMKKFYIFNERENHILVFKKNKETPNEFPREWNRIIK